jgi:hypothetical protein
MSGSCRRVTRKSLFGATFGVLVAASVVSAPPAAADEWPQVPDYPTPVSTFETKNFLTPTDLDYWNPLVNSPRLSSPYGTSTRIVCQSFHGTTFACWQADRDGNPHKLTSLPFNFPSIVGYGMVNSPSHFVYPFWDAGS